MAENGGAATSPAEVKRPSISLPAKSVVESLFRGGPAEASPGPMTLASSLFEAEPEYRSFSQLLAGAMASPAQPPEEAAAAIDARGKEGASLNLGHSRPMNFSVVQSQLFMVPPGFSPGGLLDSPALFSSNLVNLGNSHQHALAEFSSSLPSSSLTQPVSTINMAASSQPMLPITHGANILYPESAFSSDFDQISQPATIVADKPADDGYNWRKYGQKQVKGCEYPRSYYKCTQVKCPVKKKVERSVDGQVTEIIYMGQHNHDRPIPSRRSKEGGAELNGNPDTNNSELLRKDDHLNETSNGMIGLLSTKEQQSGHGLSEHLEGSSDDEELCDGEAEDGEPEHKRRNLETRMIESSSHRTVTEPRIILQTTSEVDLLDDGYRWRKYGQKKELLQVHERGMQSSKTRRKGFDRPESRHNDLRGEAQP
ncbi:probable WRKY transcription factor 3 isoform X2 [Phalaenopsis equestris]|uniref:probable WRKY transcription factor 3 isoform X2 n=1 Tax=Phalaenopsis equestris TaxID=78828 RepID=UPI0009E37108|nr:probable WRKY transcription factor 3 isoform X2 [Phalaenopsis equestris]